jgi:hypothetical protein
MLVIQPNQQKSILYFGQTIDKGYPLCTNFGQNPFDESFITVQNQLSKIIFSIIPNTYFIMAQLLLDYDE